MRRVAMMLLIPMLALLVAIVFPPSSANESTTVHAMEIGMSETAGAGVISSALLPLPVELVVGWFFALFPCA